MTSEPKRLLDDPSAPAALRDAIAASRSERVDPAVVDRVWGQLAAAQAAQGAAAASALKWQWIGLGIAALGTVGAALYLLASGGDEPSARRPAVEMVEPVEAVEPLEPVETSGPPPAEPTAATGSTPRRQPGAAPALDVSRPSAANGSAPSSVESAAPARTDELELIARARRALRDGQPARALRHADRHARAFPRGVLAEEREALAIEAMLRLGRRDGASRRLRRFEDSHPSSAYTPALRDLEESLAAD